MKTRSKLFIPWLISFVALIVSALFSYIAHSASERKYVSDRQSEFREVIHQLSNSIPRDPRLPDNTSTFQRRSLWRQHKDINTILLIESASDIAKDIPDKLNAADHLNVAVHAVSASGFDTARYHCQYALSQLDRAYPIHKDEAPQKPILRATILSVLGMLHYYHPTLNVSASTVSGKASVEEAKRIVQQANLLTGNDYLATLEGQWALSCAAAKQFDEAADHFASAVVLVKLINSFSCSIDVLRSELAACALQLRELGTSEQLIVDALDNDKCKKSLAKIGFETPKQFLDWGNCDATQPDQNLTAPTLAPQMN